MGIFDKLLGGGMEYPPLDAGSAAAQKLKEVRTPFEEFARKVKDPLEVVPAGQKTYVFIGKSPKVFGVVWIDKGQLVNFKADADQKKLSAVDFQRISDQMRDAYIQSESAERYSATIADKKVTVTLSERLNKEIETILSAVS